MPLELNLADLKSKQQFLIDEQKALLSLIREKYPYLHSWLNENGRTLDDLSHYAANIAVAAAISLGTISSTNLPPPSENMVVYEKPKIIEPKELQGLNNDEKAKLVKERYGYLIERASAKYDVDSSLVFATIMLESGGNTYAIRSEPQINDASYGLGQILYGTAKGLGFRGNAEDLYDPEINIDLIAMYHRRNMEVYGKDLSNEQLTIAYNTGNPYSKPYPGHVNKFHNWMGYVSHLMI